MKEIGYCFDNNSDESRKELLKIFNVDLPQHLKELFEKES